MRMSAITAPAHVMGTAEARRKLPSILDRFRSEGANAEPVFIGAYHRAEAVVLSVELAEKLAPLLEDLLIAEQLRGRLAGAPASVAGDVLAARLGVARAEIEAEKATLRRQLGLNEPART
jgi:hypothetical protein